MTTRMRILLVDPPFQIFMGFHRYYYPLGLGYIAAILNMHGHSTRIYDAEHSSKCKSLTWLEASHNYHLYLDALNDNHHTEWNNFSNLLTQIKPQVVGISVLSVKVPSALRLASLCKEFDKNIIVVMGGDHATIAPQELLANENVDFVVRGEGEYTMLELVEYLNKDRSGIEKIDGLSYKENGLIIHNKSRELIHDLNALPFPAIESIFDLKNYRPVDLGIMMTTRGCPYSCTYCGVANTWGHKVRFRSIENIVSEIKMLKNKYDVTYFSFRDASFTINREHVLEFCQQLIREDLNISWECLTRLDLLDDDLVSKMKNSGCITIRIGIETGNVRLMQQMGRKLTLNQIKKAAKMLNEHDMFWAAYFMFGVPGETKETIEDSLKLITEINPPFVTISRYSLIAGTEMYEEAKRSGLISEPVDWSLESNQSTLKSYSQHINQKEFKGLMEKAADFVVRYNEKNVTTTKKDNRLKIE
jgi:anaerobic magnesium-protoporphyrin IX monomethyl ester cyclase